MYVYMYMLQANSSVWRHVYVSEDWSLSEAHCPAADTPPLCETGSCE